MVPTGRGAPPVGSLKIVTTKIKPGYLRKNGVPYSANATLTEYLDRIDETNGAAYLVVTTTVADPAYLGRRSEPRPIIVSNPMHRLESVAMYA